jgi:hypothetical protein
MLEDGGVETRNVNNWEDGDCANDDGPEEELVGNNVAEERETVLRLVGVKTEERAADRLEFPGGEENEPGEFCENSTTSAEDSVALIGVFGVTVAAEVAIANTKDDDNKGGKGKSSHKGSVNQHISNDFPRENTGLGIVWISSHDIRGSPFKAETEGRESRSQHVNPKNLKWSKWEYRVVVSVSECKSTDEEDNFSNVGNEKMEDELLNVVEHAATFLDGVDNRGKVVVSEYNIGSGFGDVRTTETHSNTNISALEGWRVVDTVTSHGSVSVTTMEGINHADLGLWSATSNNERQEWKGINLLISEGIKLGGGLDHGFGDIGSEGFKVSWDDTNFTGNGASSSGMI